MSLMVVSVFFENMGLLYKRKLAPLELLDDLLSGPIISSWEKVQPLWIGLRAQYGQAQWAEWFELLNDAIVDRLAQLEGQRPPGEPLARPTTRSTLPGRPAATR